MAISRRQLGLGLIATATVGTGGALYLRNAQSTSEANTASQTIAGFIGGEKEAFVNNPKVIARLAHDHDLAMNARRAGSVEQVRDPALLAQHPSFLWPSSSVLVDVAKQSGVKIKQDEVILNTPIVLYSWTPIAEALVQNGSAHKLGTGSYTVDAKKLIDALLAGKSWSDFGVAALFGRIRLQSTDPTKSNSGFMFAGLTANLLAGDVVDQTKLATVDADVKQLFHVMGYKPSSSGKMFDDYIAGGMGGAPMIVGYENQLVEWIIADEKRWTDLTGRDAVQPVTLYLEPTILSAHPFIALTDEATKLIPALLDPEIQAIAWQEHGFRGPLGRAGTTTNHALQGRMPPSIAATMPMPDAVTMLKLIDSLASG
jgi:hypothetical protein